MTKTRKLKKGECKDIKKIDIQFENCELASFTREEITNIFLHDIRKHISICINAVIEDYEARDIWLVIPYDIAKTKEHSFFGDYKTIIDRLGIENGSELKDITHIYITYNTGEEECISCVWEVSEDGNDFWNPAQISKIETDESGKKFLTISISPDNCKKE